MLLGNEPPMPLGCFNRRCVVYLMCIGVVLKHVANVRSTARLRNGIIQESAEEMLSGVSTLQALVRNDR
jgi:hypothetical protein